MTKNKLCYLFKHIWEREECHANNTLREFDLTFSQSYALDFIIESDETVTQRELEEYLGVRHSAVVGIVSRLEAKKLIVSVFSKKDQRQKMLVPTQRGREIYDAVAGDKINVQNDLVKGFSQEEEKILCEMLERIYHNLDECS